MNFFNAAMLAGVAGVLVPVAIHLIANRRPKRIPWGAWMFLDATVKKRRKRMLLEEILLLACRCMLPAALALALARPFVRGGSEAGWWAVPALLLAGTALLGTGFALWTHPKTRALLTLLGAGMLAGGAGWVWMERGGAGGSGGAAAKDIAIIVDGSGSMGAGSEGKANFELAKEAARKYVEQAPRGSAFSVIAGGPVPEVAHLAPVRDRREAEGAILRMRAPGGTMEAGPCLAAAAAALANGRNAEKLVIVVGDGQAAGWHFGEGERWRAVERIFGQFERPPKIVWRTLPLPGSVRNLAVGSIRTVRDMVGTDREAAVKVTVVNSGSEAVTPKSVKFVADGVEQAAGNVSQLAPGESAEFEFRHRFRKTGGAVVEARVEADDDMPGDDVAKCVIPVTAPRKILIVDGEGGEDVLRRSSAYLALALRPDFAPLIADKRERQNYAAELAGRRRISEYPVETVVEDAAATVRRKGFAGFAAVALCGVTALPEETMEALAKYCAAGGGIWVVPGARMDAAKFNGWELNGEKVMPCEYGEFRAEAGEEAPRLDRGAFGREVFGGAVGGDAAAAEVRRRWGMELRESGVAAAKFTDGKAALATRSFGAGYAAAMAMGLDPVTSELPMRGSFVPFAHSVAEWLTRRTAVKLDIAPSDGAEIVLTAGSASELAGDEPGVTGYYYSEPGWKGEARMRMDKGGVRFWWGTNPPMKGMQGGKFSARWFGELVPKESGTYDMMLRTDGKATFKIDGKWGRRFELEAGRRYKFQAEYSWTGGNHLHCVMAWKKPDGKTEDVTRDYLRAKMTGPRGAGMEVAVKDPRGEQFFGELFTGEQGLTLGIDRALMPGIYEATAPETLKEALAGVVDGRGKIMFSVSAGMAESDMAPARSEDLAGVAKHAKVEAALNDEEVVRALKGEAFGREIWRYLAWAALGLLAAETLLCRWIAKTRRTGETIDAGFGGRINFGGNGK